MKKTILFMAVLISGISFAKNYEVIISKEHNKYILGSVGETPEPEIGLKEICNIKFTNIERAGISFGATFRNMAIYGENDVEYSLGSTVSSTPTRGELTNVVVTASGSTTGWGSIYYPDKMFKYSSSEYYLSNNSSVSPVWFNIELKNPTKVAKLSYSDDQSSFPTKPGYTITFLTCDGSTAYETVTTAKIGSGLTRGDVVVQ